MKPGAIKLRYPGGDPENGPAYMQQWTGEVWQCLVHKPEYDYDQKLVFCSRCNMVLLNHKEVKLITNKALKKL